MMRELYCHGMSMVDDIGGVSNASTEGDGISSLRFQAVNRDTWKLQVPKNLVVGLQLGHFTGGIDIGNKIVCCFLQLPLHTIPTCARCLLPVGDLLLRHVDAVLGPCGPAPHKVAGRI